ncbi:MAG: acetyl-CoA acetyltransferase [Bdellovibrionales bacterium RIFOXYD1_FULL_44_7]|nr:MAG: acetyl-CoA acetyltransferase [Bdellovibrionales bacterium RIFOXYD1_FULL_44_7]
MHEVVIVSAARTPLGAFQGSLASVPAPRLGAVAIEGALKKAGIKPDVVSEVIMGNVLSAGQGQAPARQAAIYAGIPHSVPAITVNKVCGSGMKAIMLGAQSIILGDSDVVVAGGMENMSLTPYYVQNARSGFKMGHQQLLDSMIYDGLWDPYSNQHMGNCGELCAREKNFSRKEQDDYAIMSFKRAQEAQKSGKFKDEIVPVPVPGRKGEVSYVENDESPSKVQFDRIPTLRPAFDKNGSVTAANASSINDGAAAVILMSAEKARQLGVKPLAKLLSYGTFSQAPEWFTTSPSEAMRRAMKKASSSGWEVKDVDLFEVNEAFALVALAAQREMNIPIDKLNVRGGGISLGHPIGASGARIVVSIVSALKDLHLKRGVAGICIGGGEATAVCIEMM